MSGNKLSKEAKVRLETMCRTNDGFEIADVDMRLRGPGDIMGTRQSGLLNFKIADLAKDQQILQAARHFAQKILSEDIRLEKPENSRIREEFIRQSKGKTKYSRIS
jgi:ATP-dependent DNA helicase RecG